MQHKHIILYLFFFLMTSCNDQSIAELPKEQGAVQIDIENFLEQEVKISSISSTKEGKTNPTEVTITFTNITNTHQRFIVDGQWLDAQQHFNGGNQQILHLAPQASETLHVGTRSPRATQYQATLKATENTQDQQLSEFLAKSKQPIAEGYGMRYSETPATEKIPSWSIRGVVNGTPFDGKTLIFYAIHKDQWSLEIYDKAFDSSASRLIARRKYPDMQYARITFSEAPGRGKTFQQSIESNGNMFQIKPSADAQDTITWSASVAYYIEITDWDKDKSTTYSCGTPKKGKASGRLYISFKGFKNTSREIKNSWISGTFDDAIILYCGS